MHVQSDQQPPTDLRTYLAILRHRKWTIVLLTGLVVASALLFSFRQTPVYTSETRVLVRPVGSTSVVIPPQVNLDTERALVDSVAVASRVREDLELSGSPEMLLDPLDVSVETNTEILSIRYTDLDPLTAQRLAQGFAEAYLGFRREQTQQELQAQATGIRTQISEIEDRIADLNGQIAETRDPQEQQALSVQHDTLVARLAVLEQELLRAGTPIPGGGGEIVTPADLPDSPSSPDHVRNAVLALVVGLALGIGMAFLRERLDDRLRGRRDFEEHAGAPILAAVPKVSGWKDARDAHLVSLSEPKGSAAEAYRTLRTNIQFIARAGSFKVLTVTSATVGEGKTTTTANIAVAMAQAGSKVIAVSGDLRKPRLHRFFDVRNDVGITSVLSGKATLREVIQRSSLQWLRVIASGPVPPNPAELLGTEEMERLIEQLRAYADFVVFDTPPLLAVSDALALGPKTDGVLIVADARSTTRGAVGHVREQMEQVGGKIVGGLLNNFDPSAARYDPYYYRYYYTYRYLDEEAAERAPGNGARRSSEAIDMWK
jgi:polysaccharide biosynthesis transport protein